MNPEKTETNTALEIKLDTLPFEGYIASLEHFVQSSLSLGKLSFDLCNLVFEVGRFEPDPDATRTGVLAMTLYPSDAFLRFGAAIFAEKGH